MPNVLKLSVENPDEILNAGLFGAGALIRVQSATSSTGVFADVAGTGATPTVPIVTLIRAYTAYDPAGASSTWYRTRFENAGGTRTSDWTTVFQVGDEDAGYIVSIYDVKQRLGIAAADTTSDEDLLELIAAVTSWIRGKAGRRLGPNPASGDGVFLFDGWDALEGGKLLPIPQGVRSVTTLEVAPYTGAAYLTIPATDYFLQPAEHQRDEPGAPATELWMTDIPSSTNPYPFFPDGFSTIRLTGQLDWPYAPPAVRDVALRLIVKAFQSRQSGEANIVGTDEYGNRTVSPEVLGKDLHTINRYSVKTISII